MVAERSRLAGYRIVAKPASGLDRAAYDLTRIRAWALVIFGALDRRTDPHYPRST
jgi:hypothetical protein